VSSSQPKVQENIKSWEPDIGLAIIGDEMQKVSNYCKIMLVILPLV
jgi:hypothetical protein